MIGIRPKKRVVDSVVPFMDIAPRSPAPDVPEIPLGGMNPPDTSQYQPAQPLMDGIKPDSQDETSNIDYDQWVRDVRAGKRTPPFSASPEWRAAEQRVFREQMSLPTKFQQWMGGEPDAKTTANEIALHPRTAPSTETGGLGANVAPINTPYEGIAPTTRNPEDEPNYQRRIGRLETEGASKNKWWKRMLQGGLRGLATGGLGGAILGATVEGISPRVNTKFKTEGYLNEANTRVAEQNARNKAEQDAALRNAQLQGEQAETFKKRLQAVQQQNPLLWQAIEKKGFIDKSDQAAIQAAGYGYVPEGSWYQTETTYDKDGNLLWTPKTGQPNYQPTGIQDPKQGTAIYKGRPMKPSEAGRLESDDTQFNTRETNDITVKNAELLRQTINDNYTRQRQYETDVRSVLSKQVDLLTKLNKGDTSQDADLQKELADLQWSLQDINDKYTKSATAAEADTLRSQYDTLSAQMETLQQRIADRVRQRAGNDREITSALSKLKMPKRPKWQEFKPVSAATVPAATGRTTESAARNYLSSKGLKGKALEDAIRAGKAAGEIY